MCLTLSLEIESLTLSKEEGVALTLSLKGDASNVGSVSEQLCRSVKVDEATLPPLFLNWVKCDGWVKLDTTRKFLFSNKMLLLMFSVANRKGKCV